VTGKPGTHRNKWTNIFVRADGAPIILSLSIFQGERSNLLRVVALLWGIACGAHAESPAAPPAPVAVPILAYHRVGPTVADSMTITTAVFEAQLQYLHDNGFTVIPLRSLVDYRLGKAPPPPPRSVVITFDDGHRSVHEVALPLIRKYRIPVTLFIYPSAISNAHAPYAMSWAQLGELAGTGLFDVQSHTYWHPNFKIEKRRLAPAEYNKLVAIQLQKSRATLEKRLGTPVDMLAWPFGIYDDDLQESARQAGYTAAFSIDGRQSRDQDRMFALPRHMVDNSHQGKIFAQMVAEPARGLVAAQ
jgi:peptidoglycan/xylan/chitin deacetylase (PgdA/CDA1 family)